MHLVSLNASAGYSFIDVAKYYHNAKYWSCDLRLDELRRFLVDLLVIVFLAALLVVGLWYL